MKPKVRPRWFYVVRRFLLGFVVKEDPAAERRPFMKSHRVYDWN